MGLSASQVRYLSLTARQTDLEYQAQIINTRRIDLANKSSDATRAYTEGMNNKVIRVASISNTTDGITTKVWNELTFENLVEKGYQIIGAKGESLVPSPYKDYTSGTQFTYAEYMALPVSERSKCTSNGDETYNLKSTVTVFKANDTLSEAEFTALGMDASNFEVSEDEDGKKSYKAKNDIKFNGGSTIDFGKYTLLTKEAKGECTPNNVGTYTANSCLRIVDKDYTGIDIQSLLVSGRAQLVTNAFFQFLQQHGYGTGTLTDGNNEETSYEALVEQFETDTQTRNINTVVDWQADTTNMFKQDFYTEDDAKVLADYEAATAEIQAEDKKLELELKKIETEHKAIQTEMDAVSKVIQKNIETTYKTFG